MSHSGAAPDLGQVNVQQIIQEAMEGRFLLGKTSTVNFEEPSPTLDRVDNRELRERINSLTSARVISDRLFSTLTPKFKTANNPKNAEGSA
jgi:hypothetical protein